MYCATFTEYISLCMVHGENCRVFYGSQIFKAFTLNNKFVFTFLMKQFCLIVINVIKQY